MRNRISHGYFDIDAETIWRTAQEDLPVLLQALERLRGNLRGG